MAEFVKYIENKPPATCPVCGHRERCKHHPELGLDRVLCFREDGENVSGYRRVKGPNGDCTVYVREGSRADRRRSGGRRAGKRKGRKQATSAKSTSDAGDKEQARQEPSDLNKLAEEYAAAATEEDLTILARELGVSELSLRAIGTGVQPPGPGITLRTPRFTFPEKDAAGNIVGILVRRFDGSKRVGRGEKRGLTIPNGLDKAPGPTYVVEGPTDVAACRTMGLMAVGRPFAKGGVLNLTKLLRNHEDVIIVGENDRKDDGKWPGLEGARQLAQKLSKSWKRPVPFVLPPKGTKDVRDFLRQNADEDSVAVGRKLFEHLQQNLQGCEPQGTKSNSKPDLPKVFLPGHGERVSSCAAQLGRLLARTGRFYNRGGGAVEVRRDETGGLQLNTVKPAALPSAFESVARLFQWKKDKEGNLIQEPTYCTESVARLILASDEFMSVLPPIKIVSPCPVLVARGGELVQVSGYDRESGVYAEGERAPEMPPEEAVHVITKELLRDFNFRAPPDESRAIAAFLTPALVHGNLLSGRAPLDLGEANSSQAGKGFRNRLVAAVYRQRVTTITQRKGGVGGLDESFSSALVRGANFVSLDNMRGKVDSPEIESFLTEDFHEARVPYSASQRIDTRRIVVMLTSNKAEITVDLANRSSIVQLTKQLAGYAFQEYPEGNILDHVRANQPRFLAAVFAIIKAWYDAGKPRLKEVHHDFRAWAQVLGWIIENVFQAEPLLDGHAKTAARTANPRLSWLRDVAMAIERAGRSGEDLWAHHILDIIADEPEIEIPGLGDNNLTYDPVREQVLMALGKRLRACFGQSSRAEVDDYVLTRTRITDESGRPKWILRLETPFTGVSHEPPHEISQSPRRNPVSRAPRETHLPFCGEDENPEGAGNGQITKGTGLSRGTRGCAGNEGDLAGNARNTRGTLAPENSGAGAAPAAADTEDDVIV